MGMHRNFEFYLMANHIGLRIEVTGLEVLDQRGTQHLVNAMFT